MVDKSYLEKSYTRISGGIEGREFRTEEQLEEAFKYVTEKGETRGYDYLND